MQDEFATPRLHSEDLQHVQRRVRQLLWAVAILAIVCVVGFSAQGLFLWRQSSALTRTRDDIIFGRFVHYDYDSDDYVVPVENTIQFFHDGYSMQFDKVEFVQDGLFLSGEIGNPNQFRITGLALTFAVRPYPDKIRDKWDHAGKRVAGWSSDWDLGHTMVSIGDLEPGKTAKFRMTVPGIRHTADPIRIAVLFSGKEHYSYLPRRDSR